MSRSSRKTSICGITTAVSEKLDKRRGNRKARRANRVCLAKGAEPIQTREVSDVWSMAKDGKHFFSQTKFPELLRK